MPFASFIVLVRVYIPACTLSSDKLGLRRHEVGAVYCCDHPRELLRVDQNLLEQDGEELLRLGVAIGLVGCSSSL